MGVKNFFLKAIWFVLSELIGWFVAALFMIPLIGLTIYVFGFLHGYGEGVGIAFIVAYIILVPLFFINIGKLHGRFCAVIKSCFAKLIGKPQEKPQDPEKAEDTPLQAPKPVWVRLVEYCIGGIMLLAYAGLTICVFMFLSPPDILGTVGVVVHIIFIFAYILFAILFLLQFGKWHDRVCSVFFGREKPSPRTVGDE